MKRIVVLLAAAMLMVSAAYADAGGPSLAVRSFQFRFKQADRAAAVIKPLISADGSVSIQPNSNTLVVTDHAENLKAIGQAIGQFDVAARNLRLQLELVAASRESAPRPVPADLTAVSSKLSGVLRFNSFERVGEIVIDGREGDPVITNVDENYHAEFKFGEFDPLSNTVQISDFHLSRIQNGQLQSLLKTSLNLKVGQTLILGASRMPDSQKALMLVLVAKQN